MEWPNIPTRYMESSSDTPLFTGEFCHALDSKNRITIPSDWRRPDSDSDIFLILPDPKSAACLLAMPPTEFRAMCENAGADEKLSLADSRVFKTMLSSSARKCATDKQGRMVLPEEHCRKIGLHGEVLLVGGFERIEIWAPDAWTRFHEANSPTLTRVSTLKGV